MKKFIILLFAFIPLLIYSQSSGRGQNTKEDNVYLNGMYINLDTVRVGGAILEDSYWLTGKGNAFTIYLDNDATGNSGVVIWDDWVRVNNDTTGYQLDGSGWYFTVAGQDTFRITDSRAVTRGLEYAADYSAGFTDRTLVDKAYVDGVAGGASADSLEIVIGTGTGITSNDYFLYDDTILYLNKGTIVTDSALNIYWTRPTNTDNGGISEDNVVIGTDIFPFAAGADENIFIGNSFTIDNVTGNHNIAIGNEIGAATFTTSTDNILIGRNIGNDISGGNYNILQGYEISSGSGSYNIMLGYSPGDNSGTSGSSNIFIGYNAGNSVNSGEGNILMGFDAGGDVVSGADNVILGREAMNNADAASGYNVVIGYQALGSVSGDVDWNVIIGHNAAEASTDADVDSTIAIGAWALDGASTLQGNTVIGVNAGLNNAYSNIILLGNDVSADANDQMVLGEDHELRLSDYGDLNHLVEYDSVEALLVVDADGNTVHELPRDSAVAWLNITAGDYTIDAYGNADGTGEGYTFNAASLNNVFLGTAAGNDAVSGQYNFVAITNAGAALTSGDRNILIGVGAGQLLDADGYNIVLGSNALDGDADAQNVVLIGRLAGSGTVFDNVVGIGYNAGLSSIGTEAVAIGLDAGSSIGNYSIAIGSQAGEAFNGTYSVAIGYLAGNAANSNDYSFFGGNEAGRTAVNADYVVVIGDEAGYNADAASGSVFIGENAGYSINDINNVAIGREAMSSASGSTASYNVAVGYQTLAALTTGDYNLALGDEAGAAITTGAGNMLFGHRSGYLTTGSYNTGIGYFTVSEDDPTAGFQIAICYGALLDATEADSCIAFGANTLRNNTFPRAIAIGHSAEVRDTAQLLLGSDHEIILSDYGKGNHLLEVDSIDYIAGIGDFDTENIVGEIAKDSARAWLGIDTIPSGYRDQLQAEVTGTNTATLFNILPVNVSGGVAEVDVPAGAVAGDWFAVSDSRENAAANNITVDFTGAGYNLHASSQDYVINGDGDFARFTYVNATIGWIVSN